MRVCRHCGQVAPDLRDEATCPGADGLVGAHSYVDQVPVRILPDDVRVVRQWELVFAVKAGLTADRIAGVLGVTPQAVTHHLHRLGYSYTKLGGWVRV